MVNLEGINIGSFLNFSCRLKSDIKDVIYPVQNISASGFVGFSAGFGYQECPIEYAMPVNLNNDICVAAGLVEWLPRNDGAEYKINDMFSIKEHLVSYSLMVYIKGHNYFVKNIRYVHELQNLYYDITGKECELSTKSVNENKNVLFEANWNYNDD